jgi:quinol monooxygenase YgiN
MEIRVVATVVAKPEHVDEVIRTLQAVVAPSREESACLQYELHQLLDDANTFVFFERWQSLDALSEHEKTAHFQQFVQQLSGKLEKLEVTKLKAII